MLNVAFHRRHTPGFLLFLLLIASLMLPVAAGRAESEGHVRFIVVLRAPAAADRYDLMAPEAIAQVQEHFAPAVIAAGAREIDRLDTLPVVIVEAPRSALNRLATHPLVANVAEDALAAPHLSGSVPLTHADLAQQAANGAGVAIAIVDTGVDAAHPFLGGAGDRRSMLLDKQFRPGGNLALSRRRFPGVRSRRRRALFAVELRPRDARRRYRCWRRRHRAGRVDHCSPGILKDCQLLGVLIAVAMCTQLRFRSVTRVRLAGIDRLHAAAGESLI
jgi:hypothetical protein